VAAEYEWRRLARCEEHPMVALERFLEKGER
jgi:hypothetical protein